MFELVVGLEVHAQLNTKTKLFCSCSTSFGEEPNKNTCPVCIGLPGSLPVINKEAVIKAMKFGNAINAKVNDNSVFERKNYFYPDLPCGYQISQLEIPIVEGGDITIKIVDAEDKTIKLNRAHLETDAGKNIHKTDKSYVDLNRAGTPLLEIVTEPDFGTIEEVTSYLRQLHSIVRYLDISDANLQEGSFRCDVNISIRPKGDDKLYTRAEIKNLNSFKFIEKAIAYEFERHVEAWEDGTYDRDIIQETRLFDEKTMTTKPMRGKEEAMDYRYFPDPDIKPIKILPEMYELAKSIPEMPREKENRYIAEYGISENEVERLVQDVAVNKVFESLVCDFTSEKSLRTIISILMVELGAYMNEKSIQDINKLPISLSQIREVCGFVDCDVISMGGAKKALSHILKEQEDDIELGDTLDAEIETPISVEKILDELNLKQISDESEILEHVKRVLKEDAKNVEAYKAGKEKLFGSFVGKVMKATSGQANPQLVNKLIKKELGV